MRPPWHRKSARPGQHVTVTVAARRAQSALTVALTSLAWGLWYYGPITVADAKPRQTTHIAIPAALFEIAESVCRNNGGYRSVTVERKSDVFSFTCADGLTLRDTIVRVR